MALTVVFEAADRYCLRRVVPPVDVRRSAARKPPGGNEREGIE